MFGSARRESASARVAAQGILADVWAGRPFPVDPVWIAGQLGIRVVEAELEREVSGALIKEAGQSPVILLHSTDHRNRKRFTCAHELGHYIHRRGDCDDEFSFVELRSPLSSAGLDPAEVYANQFAASLLMPEAEVREQYAEKEQSILLAYYFGVSDEAMRHRLRTLKLA